MAGDYPTFPSIKQFVSDSSCNLFSPVEPHVVKPRIASCPAYRLDTHGPINSENIITSPELEIKLLQSRTVYEWPNALLTARGAPTTKSSFLINGHERIARLMVRQLSPEDAAERRKIGTIFGKVYNGAAYTTQEAVKETIGVPHGFYGPTEPPVLGVFSEVAQSPLVFWTLPVSQDLPEWFQASVYLAIFGYFHIGANWPRSGAGSGTGLMGAMPGIRNTVTVERLYYKRTDGSQPPNTINLPCMWGDVYEALPSLPEFNNLPATGWNGSVGIPYSRIRLLNRVAKLLDFGNAKSVHKFNKYIGDKPCFVEHGAANALVYHIRSYIRELERASAPTTDYVVSPDTSASPTVDRSQFRSLQTRINTALRGRSRERHSTYLDDLTPLTGTVPERLVVDGDTFP